MFMSGRKKCASRFTHFLIVVLMGILLLCLFTDCGKKKNKIVNADSEANVDQEIISLYYQWASLSRQHKYAEMLALTYPGSNFEGRTNVCKSAWDDGGELSYTFSDVSVLYWEEDNTPYVVGNILLYQGPDGPNFYNGFASGCQKLNNKWKLDGINSNSEPDWWR